MEYESINYLPTDELVEFMLLHTITSLLFLIEIGKEELLAMEGITAELVLEIYYIRDQVQDKK
jgi:hypothetical protein